MEDEKRLKMAVIAGASRALKYKEKERMISDEEVLQMVTRDVDEILKNVD